ncbi:IS630 family transposase [Kibdelosporangium philippinense]|uniref:IS630 family transposase n=3 Tax=Kibdelosporangium philippinense TaxID=211113 RepID=A0ABS8ZB72_9PSEU|nr:IS630 family transposase [Kibdelosporangium philippinense]MCE7003926.1 IS630 family transposase [Kibdelosporangium philippinense]
MVLAVGMELTADERAELRALVNSPDVAATVATRARILMWSAEGRAKKEIAELAGVSRPTVDLWLSRYAADGVGGLLDRPRGAGREQVPVRVRARILAASRTSPPIETGLSHWSSREMAAWITRVEGVSVSHHYVAKLWRDNGLRPHRQGTFKLSKDPEFADKVADIVGLYLDPPGGAVVLSVDEKTQIQALDRTQPLLPITFDASEQRTHDYRRHGITNLFAALDVATGEVYGECHPVRDGANFLAFLKKAVKPHAGKNVHVVLDNLSIHGTPEVMAWLEANPHVRFHHTPKGSSWINQIEIWFGIITRQAIRRGTFTSVKVLIGQIRDYINHWNAKAKPFIWTATAEEILAKVRVVQASVKKLLNNNAK